MRPADAARAMLVHESHALLERLDHVEPFALNMPMVPAAAPAARAWSAIEAALVDGRKRLRTLVHAFLHWLDTPEGRRAPPGRLQARFTLLRLRFTAVLANLDLFADTLSQRSEHGLGTRLAGLDVLAEDALALPPGHQAPPLVCYLDTGLSAAIRRARTRLPGGGDNPVAIIRVPRERMVGTAIGGSLVHEVGHQAAALLGLVRSVRQVLRAVAEGGGSSAAAWRSWTRWASEIVADLWSVARLGVSGVLGLSAVVSLPRPFVFRLNLDDSHPMPWLRVHVACALGDALYPDPQWRGLAATWSELYPPEDLKPAVARPLADLTRTLPALVRLLVEHRPSSLGGRSLREMLADARRTPAALRQTPARVDALENLEPTRAFATLGQARADGRLRPGQEAALLEALLCRWALRRTFTRLPERATRAPAPPPPHRLVLVH